MGNFKTSATTISDYHLLINYLMPPYLQEVYWNHVPKYEIYFPSQET